VTIIAGGGFHGKSTLLRAISSGVYDKVAGDGREHCITIRSAACMRAEDGRSVSHVDISPFLSDLPKASGLVPERFSTSGASGSTSQVNLSLCLCLRFKIEGSITLYCRHLISCGVTH